MFALTRSEMQIMYVLWREKRPLSRMEILELSAGYRTWKAGSIHILLNSMLEKNAIEVVGFEKTGKRYGRTYAPAVTEAAYSVMQMKALPSWQKDPAAAAQDLLSALVDTSEMNERVLEQLRKILGGEALK